MVNGNLAFGQRVGLASRFSQLAPLDPVELRALEDAETALRTVGAHREIFEEGRPVAPPSIVVSGWAARSRVFADGRRQILGLLLPGDLIGSWRHRQPRAATGTLALTEVTLCPAPRPASPDGALAEAYARSAALDEFYLYRQIARLGRLSARERVADLLLEVRERLAVVGLASPDRFPLRMTQELLADTLGLTSVHVNRTLQSLRRDGLLDLAGGIAYLKNIDVLTRLADHRSPELYEG
jgi:CRP-like cAMP-binding protein